MLLPDLRACLRTCGTYFKKLKRVHLLLADADIYRVWAADHDLDDQAQGQVNSYSARGVLIESTNPSWFIGTASEHHTYYQYNLNKAANVFIGLAQTETVSPFRYCRYRPTLILSVSSENLQPYYQPTPAVPAPFTAINATLGDPTWPTDLKSAWALYIQDSHNILVGGAGDRKSVV